MKNKPVNTKVDEPVNKQLDEIIEQVFNYGVYYATDVFTNGVKIATPDKAKQSILALIASELEDILHQWKRNTTGVNAMSEDDANNLAVQRIEQRINELRSKQ